MTTGSGMEAVTTGVSDVMSIVNTMITTITSNAILAALLAAGFVFVALAIFRGLKSSAVA